MSSKQKMRLIALCSLGLFCSEMVVGDQFVSSEDHYLKAEAESYKRLTASAQYNAVILVVFNNLNKFENDHTSEDFISTFSSDFLDTNRLSKVVVKDGKMIDSMGSEICFERNSDGVILIKRVAKTGQDFRDYEVVEVKLDSRSGEMISFRLKNDSSQ